MRSLILIVCLIVGGGSLFAQDSTALSPGNYTLVADSSFLRLTEDYKAYNKKSDVEDGYRIQVTYTDVRTDIYNSKGRMYQEFPDISSYVEYAQPYYKLRLGDFRTRLDATYYLQQVILLYPGAFIVKDKVKFR